MSQNLQMSGPTLKLLKLFVENPLQAQSGAEISKAAKIGSGTLYPLLQRLERALDGSTASCGRILIPPKQVAPAADYTS